MFWRIAGNVCLRDKQKTDRLPDPRYSKRNGW